MEKLITMEMAWRLIVENPLPHIYGKLIYDELAEAFNLEIISVNKSFARLAGWDEGEIDNLNKFFHYSEVDYQEGWKEAVQTDFYEGYRYVKESKRWYKVAAYIQEGYSFVLRLEEDHKLGKQTTMLIEHLPIPACCKDENGRYIAVSDLYSKYFGKDIDDVIGKTAMDLFDSEEAEKILQRENEALNCGEVLKYRIQDEKFFGFSDSEYTKIPCWNKEHKYIGLIAYAMDLSYQNSYQWMLDEKEKLFREISKHMRDVLVISSIDENGAKISYVSPAFREMFELDEREFYQNRLCILSRIDEEYHQLFRNMNDEEKQDEILSITRTTGEKRWIWVRCLPIKDIEGESIRRIIVFSDITERRKKELHFEQLRTDLLANISREFEAPLNLIFSALNMLEIKLDKLDVDNRQYYEKYMGIMKQNQARLLKLINNLIGCTNLDEGYVEYCPGNYDIVEFTEQICQSVVSFVQQKQLTLTFDTNVEQHILSFDLEKLETVLLNLLSNGIKYNRINGKIGVVVDVGEDEIRIMVRDTGIGIPQAKKEIIFERFQQVDHILTQYGEGSGIGLSIVKELVNLHGGRIELNSTVGVGSEFTVVIPNKQEESGYYQICRGNEISKKIAIEFSDIEV